MMLLVVALSLASLGFAVWLVLLYMVTQEDWIDAAYNKVLTNMIMIQELRKKDALKRQKLSRYRGVALSVMKIFLSGDSAKEIARLERQNEALQSGKLKSLNVFVMPGYVLQRKFDGIGRGEIYKSLVVKCMELYGRKHAENKTKHLLAGLLSYPIFGLSAVLCLGAILFAAGQTNGGIMLMTVGAVLILVLVYAMYDDVADKVKKRRENIARQFPNVVSKLALLVSSGMIVAAAWKQTAYSQEGELYAEMRKTGDELEQNIAPEAAYGSFINRCNTKETSKLASAIIQNLSKGNAEIGVLLQSLAKESWQERRHMAKRNAEKANSKLMIPSMLLFAAILIIIMVPIAMSFSSF